MAFLPIFPPMGTFYIVSTPIGNLSDLSPRAGEVLERVALLLAEDTRRSSILLTHLGIRTPLRSCHRHNETQRIREVLDHLSQGHDVGLVSDAGTPLVSDPGERLVEAVLEAGHEVVPIPGPSAVLAALVASGLPALPFTFLGFVPRKGRERREMLDRVGSSRETVVLFESPERLAELLAELAGREGGGERRGSVSRELTKRHEETRRGTMDTLARYYQESPPRGEVTVVIEPAPLPGHRADVDREAARSLGSALLARGTSPSRAAREVARRLDIPRNQAYALIQGLKDEPLTGGGAGLEPEGEAVDEERS